MLLDCLVKRALCIKRKRKGRKIFIIYRYIRIYYIVERERKS